MSSIIWKISIILLQQNLDIPGFLGESKYARYIGVHGISRSSIFLFCHPNIAKKSIFSYFHVSSAVYDSILPPPLPCSLYNLTMYIVLTRPSTRTYVFACKHVTGLSTSRDLRVTSPACARDCSSKMLRPSQLIKHVSSSRELMYSGPGKGPRPQNKKLSTPKMLQKTVCKNINQKKSYRKSPKTHCQGPQNQEQCCKGYRPSTRHFRDILCTGS